jgi:hypothetical protein
LDCWFIDENGVVVDITGAKIFFTVKDKTSDDDDHAILKKDVVASLDPQSGHEQITLTPTDTSSLLGNYLYSIKIKLSTGKIYSVAEGTICFRKEIAIRET